MGLVTADRHQPDVEHVRNLSGYRQEHILGGRTLGDQSRNTSQRSLFVQE